jgi:hypothetical protein
VKTALPKPLSSRQAPFPFTSMFQNGPRRQGCAPENLFKPGKDSPPPRKKRAPLPAPGRSEDLPMRRERGQTQRPKPSQLAAAYRLPMVGPEAFPSVLFRSRKLKIRARPVDDVNNLRHHGKCQRCFASTAIQIRRNALFTSPEYAHDRSRYTRSRGSDWKRLADARRQPLLRWSSVPFRSVGKARRADMPASSRQTRQRLECRKAQTHGCRRRDSQL